MARTKKLTAKQKKELRARQQAKDAIQRDKEQRQLEKEKLRRGRVQQPVRSAAGPRRNGPCECGSGLKYKDCCGAPTPTISHQPVSTVNLSHFYNGKQKKADKDFRRRYGFAPNPTQLQVFMEGTTEEVKDLVCKALKRQNAPDHFLYVVQELNMLVTPMNKGMLNDDERREYTETMERYRDQRKDTTEPA